ncbi:hypothetical protein D037_1480A, partial [Vibrio parahaemolyticus IDH02640]
MVRPTKGEPGS